MIVVSNGLVESDVLLDNPATRPARLHFAHQPVGLCTVAPGGTGRGAQGGLFPVLWLGGGGVAPLGA